MNFRNFTENEIKEIYLKSVKKDISYFLKYEILSEENKKFLDNIFSNPLHKWDVRDYPRAITILDFHEWINKHNIKSESIAYTYKDDPELSLIEYNNSTNLEYDPVKNIGDLHLLNDIDKYDFFLFNQTLEHLYNPYVSVNNIYNSLVDGGYVFTSVPTINIPHSTPIHFNGLTPMGLTMLFKTCGFEIVETGQWGNLEYINNIFSTHSWPGYSTLSNNGIRNEELNVVSCWILAKKPNN